MWVAAVSAATVTSPAVAARHKRVRYMSSLRSSGGSVSKVSVLFPNGAEEITVPRGAGQRPQQSEFRRTGDMWPPPRTPAAPSPPSRTFFECFERFRRARRRLSRPPSAPTHAKSPRCL
ncbi:hypothetical protein GCM10023220_13340 [Streptomyces ziwulingensis]|uniref:Secreted protein n=1 Tax=Streptomyces ziwulingensis TaxID=1045501 RepID=A0ABP9B368_9ACTN